MWLYLKKKVLNTTSIEQELLHKTKQKQELKVHEDTKHIISRNITTYTVSVCECSLSWAKPKPQNPAMRIRKPTQKNKKNVAAAGKEENEVKTAKLKGAERSAYFARREAAKILRTVLEGDANRRALASIKTLVYHPSVRNKKATFALICQTLKRN